MQVYVCVICKVKRPPLYVLSFEHRQVLEAVVSSVVNIEQLKRCCLLACTDCQRLIKTVRVFQQTALVGVQNLLKLLPLLQQTITSAIDPLQVRIKNEPEDSPAVTKLVEIKVKPDRAETLSEVNTVIKVEPDDSSATESCGSDVEDHLTVHSVKKIVPVRAHSMTLSVPIPVIKVDKLRGQPATAVEVRDNRLAPFMRTRLVPARGLGRGRGGTATGRGGGEANHAMPVNLPKLLPKPTLAGSPIGPADKSADTQTHTRPKRPKPAPNPWYYCVLKEHEVAAERHVARKSKEFAEAEFRCEPCVRTFASADAAETHAKLHLASAGEFACDVCTQRVGSVKELTAHHALHTLRYHCCHCRYSTPHKQMIEIHTCDPQELLQETILRRRRHIYPRPVKCKTCYAGFTHDAALARHIAKNHTEPPVPAECKECGKMFPNKYMLKKHSYKHSNKGLDGIRPELVCAECKIPFSNLTAYRNHRNSLKHANKDDWKYECDYCGKKCPNKNGLAKHIQHLHTMDRKYKCSQCPKAYVGRWRLKQHALSHSPDSRPRPHVCDQCGKAFLDIKTLREHMNIHNGLRPYACKLCPATFSFAAAAYTHNQLKHLKIKKQWKKKGPKRKADKKEMESVDNEKS